MITLEDWQTGRYREFPEFKTQEGYYEAVDALVEAYGKPRRKICSWPAMEITRSF